MKKILFVAGMVVMNICTLSLYSCGQAPKAKTNKSATVKPAASKPVSTNSRVTNNDVPPLFRNVYLRYGTISALGYVNSNKPYNINNAQEAMREYEIDSVGNAKLAQIISVYGDDCYNTTISLFEGTMEFDTTQKTINWVANKANFKRQLCGGIESSYKGDKDHLRQSTKIMHYKRYISPYEPNSDKINFELFLDAAHTQTLGIYELIRKDKKNE